MSLLIKDCEQDCSDQKGCDAVDLLIETRDRDIGGFAVRRAIPAARRRMVGPWAFFDHLGPVRFPPGEGINVRPHPHINLATVTYLFEGEMLHRDSLGHVQAITPGAINLMVAGRGIVHSERERPEVRDSEHTVHALQLWLGLPAADEETEPSFHHYPAADIPAADVDGVAVRVMIGAAYGATSPVRTFAETLYVEATLVAGQRLELPQVPERAIYVVSGRLNAAETAVPEHTMAVLRPGARVVVTAASDTRFVVIGGENIGPRFIEWNFVSSRKERIEQAKADWKAQQFPKVPGDDEEFIPLPA